MQINVYIKLNAFFSQLGDSSSKRSHNEMNARQIQAIPAIISSPSSPFFFFICFIYKAFFQLSSKLLGNWENERDSGQRDKEEEKSKIKQTNKSTNPNVSMAYSIFLEYFFYCVRQ